MTERAIIAALDALLHRSPMLTEEREALTASIEVWRRIEDGKPKREKIAGGKLSFTSEYEDLPPSGV